MIALDLSLENLYRQYYRCRRNKRNTANALRFEAAQEKHLIGLREALLERSYRPGRSVCFFTTRPKLREIFAADFRDRVVHHLLVDYLEAIWEPIFIHDSYACRRGKGVHRGVARLQRFIGRVTANGTQRAWYLQLDIKNYFMSMDKDRLFALLAARLEDAAALWLTRLLVYHDCTADYRLRDRAGLMSRVPAHKTLFHAPANQGLPIGNLNSQFFANVYLNGLDQFVKHHLRCRYYLRYCDDFLLLARDPDQLLEWRAGIEHYLRTALALELNPRQRLAPVANGVDFLGYIVRRRYLLVRRRVVDHLQTKLRAYESRLVSSRRGVCCYRFDPATLDALTATLASYLGHFKHADSRRLRQSLWSKHPFLSQYFDFDEACWKLRPKHTPPPGLRRVREQYRYFRWRFPDDLLLFRVGRFFEFYDIGETPHLASLGLRRMRSSRRGARYGFPARSLPFHLARLLARGVTVMLIGEAAALSGGVRKRIPLCRFVPTVSG